MLVVLAQPPTPEGGAPGKITLGLLRGLQARGLDVRAIAARQQLAIPDELPAGLAVEVVPVSPPSAWRSRTLRLRRPQGELAGGPFAARVREAAADVDVVQFEEPETSWVAEGLTRPSVLHLHHLARLDRDFGPPWGRRFREVLDATRAERAAMRRHRHLLASSPVVAEALRRAAPGAEVVFAPASLDPGLYRSAPLNGPPVAGIVGTADWAPTAEAMRALVGEVWPRVRELVPEAELVVAGRGTRELELPPTPGAEVVGEVASARDFFQGLSVLVFPLRRGSGVKVKVLEAMASGVPVVTTPAGAEGIESSEGIVVATEPGELARATAELLRDPVARRERGSAARTDFERRHSPVGATESVVELYRRMTS